MIVLDTNVISEPLRVEGHPAVTAWFNAQSVESLYLNTVSLAELRYGLAAMPEGRRRLGLTQRIEGEVVPLYAGRILSFDEPASRAYAQLKAAARAAGQPRPDLDLMIASICAARGFALATRNINDFADTGIEVIDPWSGPA